MKPSGTSLHKLAAQFVKHKRAGAPVCRPQTGRTKFASHKLGRPACSVSCPRGLAVSDPRSRGRSAAEAVQVPGERTRPTAQLATLDSSREHSSLNLLVLAYDEFLSGSMPGRRARPVLASPKVDGYTTGSASGVGRENFPFLICDR